MVILFIYVSQVQDECSAEWSEMLTEMNEKWEQRYRETKERYELFSEDRLKIYSDYNYIIEAKLVEENKRLRKKIDTLLVSKVCTFLYRLS